MASQNTSPEIRFKDPCHPDFSLPYNLMSHITTHWLPRIYIKLAKTCKYFFSVHRLVVINSARTESELAQLVAKCSEKNLNLWLKGTFNQWSIVSPMLPIVTYWSLFYLVIHKQTLKWSEYIKVTEFRSIKTLNFNRSHVVDDHDENKYYFLDDIIAGLKKTEQLMITISDTTVFNNEVAKGIADLLNLGQITHLSFMEIPENIDFEHFYQMGIKHPQIVNIFLIFLTPDINHTFLNEIKKGRPSLLHYEIDEEERSYRLTFERFKIQAQFAPLCQKCNQAKALYPLNPCKHRICFFCNDELTCPICDVAIIL